MAIAVFSAATVGTDLTIAICPNYNPGTRACGCPKDANGNPAPPHPVFDYAQSTPPGADGRTALQWQQALAQEAIALVTQGLVSQNPSTIASLIGLT